MSIRKFLCLIGFCTSPSHKMQRAFKNRSIK